ncbi:MAG TPA: biotin carboxylase N-terminal domain-containing protein [Steroidobacteraceae bacterium]|nr:biotin carboxylase N-terminal domain-containing protein [Steroidobacteraceae bacterium]
MIDSLLVANRGEIACRIFRTARRLGIRTIAVFSDADAGARHVREADEAVRIGPAAARESYLDIARILQAARTTHAAAIHPGYGFLSENAAFARAVTQAGFVFVGPPHSAIEAMGSKLLAKSRMRAAGVPVLPGYEGSRQDLNSLHEEAMRLGMPLIVKPAAGGGGKGMRILHEPAEVAEGLAAARRLAQSAFGDGSLLLERYLPAPRHVEVQIFGDTHGNLVHLGDRDCSIQRRHQKLLEEAPAPDLPDELRTRVRAAALVVGREIGYVGAGTVEFLFDGRDVYFMEMNTRLQVEHTVTEAVTGLDLVEWQLRVAAGERLPLEQSQIRLEGHAIEARVCAEDPERDFLPSAGTLRLMEWPAEESVRVDAGFATGDTVPESYDSLLGKVIAWAPARAAAAARLSAALERIHCVGVHTNERWLARILRAPAFLQVRHSIAYLQRHASEFRDPTKVEPAALALGALAAQLSRIDTNAAASPWAAVDGFTPNLPARVALTLTSHGQRHALEIGFVRGEPGEVVPDEAGAAGVCAAAQADSSRSHGIRVARVSQENGYLRAIVDDRSVMARCFRDGLQVHLWVGDRHHVFALEDLQSIEFSASATEGGLTTPLPGVVVAVSVEPGQAVSAGQVLMVIEAMKMEHAITAPFAGTVEAIHFTRGDRVPEGSELLALTPAGQ